MSARRARSEASPRFADLERELIGTKGLESLSHRKTISPRAGNHSGQYLLPDQADWDLCRDEPPPDCTFETWRDGVPKPPSRPRTLRCTLRCIQVGDTLALPKEEPSRTPKPWQLPSPPPPLRVSFDFPTSRPLQGGIHTALSALSHIRVPVRHYPSARACTPLCLLNTTMPRAPASFQTPHLPAPPAASPPGAGTWCPEHRWCLGRG